MFIFSCYKGLAYIDVYELTPKNLSLGIDDEYWINTTRYKTNISVRIPLLPSAMAIIEDYKSNLRVLLSGKLLPAHVNQLLNSYHKEIAALCGIEKPLTFRIARHTFATTVTLTNCIPYQNCFKIFGTY
ncbi:MAG: site-specific integrase [Bacteroidales bacterium]